MSFPGRGFKQTNALYVPVGNCADKVLQLTPAATPGSGGSYVVGAFTPAVWAANGSAPSKQTSTISTVGAGGVFRDMGKTVVSAGRTFRKVQLLVNVAATVSTGGVAGPAAGAAANVDFLTGYIELNGSPNYGNGGAANSTPAPVAMYPSVW